MHDPIVNEYGTAPLTPAIDSTKADLAGPVPDLNETLPPSPFRTPETLATTATISGYEELKDDTGILPCSQTMRPPVDFS